ncbi:MAG: radical SAM protein [Spartobacteria bacterium]|nr:radical SAM protein [Spartobacteria bacterium]
MGGIHASACPEEALKHVNAVAIGEAEGLWTQILGDAKKKALRRIYHQDQKPDLSELSIPRFDLLDYRHYVVPPLAKTPLIPIQTSRGCPNHCDFCSVARFFGHRMRHKPVEHVVREIETLRPSRVFFTDDNIGADPVYARELFAALKPLHLRWACQMSTQIMHASDLIEQAGEAGCHETLLGLESINPQSLKNMHKSFNGHVDYKALLRRLKEVGILAQVSVIFGLDEDTVDSMKRTIDTLLEWDVNYIYIAILTPFPGTPLYDRLKDEGRLTCPDWSMYDVTQVVFAPMHMSPEALDTGVWDMFKRSYSTSNIMKRIWRFKREYLRYFPKDNVLEEMYLQFHMQHAVAHGCHPFSLGLRDNTQG